MLSPRIYQAATLTINSELTLDEGASHHLTRVLRLKIDDKLALFNGKGGEFHAHIKTIQKKNVTVQIENFEDINRESPLNLCLAQCISRGEKMDFTIQKAVELGIKKIVPIFSARCNIKLDAERSKKRLQHWQAVIISACEQSGRNKLPILESPQNYDTWITSSPSDFNFILNPFINSPPPKTPPSSESSITLLVGPEGGFSQSEEALAERHAFIPLNLGPRVLRTETAGLAAITAFQCWLGDFSLFST